jgi:cytoskeletal protein CcmA (bactofilin family)
VVVNGKVEGSIRGREVLLKPHAIVVGDIQAQALTVENGAYFEGHSMRANESNLPRAEYSRSTAAPGEVACYWLNG